MKTINFNKLFRTLIIVIFLLISIFPLYFVVIGMTHDSSYLFDSKLIYRIGQSFSDNLEEITINYDLFRIVLNSLVIGLVNSFFGIVLIFLAAYGFTMFDFKARKILLYILILSMLIPGNILIINRFRLISYLSLSNTYAGLILPTVINIHVFLLLVKNIDYINKETIAAARIDGANEFQLIYYIAVPAMSGYLFIGFFNLFVQSWNNYLLPLLIVNSEDLFTLPLLISSMSDPLRFKYGAVFLSLTVLSIPVLILLFFTSKKMFRNIN